MTVVVGFSADDFLLLADGSNAENCLVFVTATAAVLPNIKMHDAIYELSIFCNRFHDNVGSLHCNVHLLEPFMDDCRFSHPNSRWEGHAKVKKYVEIGKSMP